MPGEGIGIGRFLTRPRTRGQGLGTDDLGLACALLQRMVCLGLRPPSAEGLVWPALLSRPHRPPTFLGTGGHPLTPGGNPWFPAPSFGRRVRPSPGIARDTLYPRRGLAPCTPLGERGGCRLLTLERPDASSPAPVLGGRDRGLNLSGGCFEGITGASRGQRGGGAQRERPLEMEGPFFAGCKVSYAPLPPTGESL